MVYDGSATLTAAGTRQRLVSTRTPAAWITFQAGASNTGAIYLGGNTVSSTSGVSMLTGDAIVTWPVGDINMYDLREIWFDGATTNNTVQFIYGTR